MKRRGFYDGVRWHEPPSDGLRREAVTPREHRQRRAEAILEALFAGGLLYVAGWSVWTLWRLLG